MNEEEKTSVLARSKDVVVSFLGGATGGLIGGAVAGPQGVIAGAFVGTVVEYALDDFGQRMLSRREAGRIASVAEMAARAIAQKLQAGEKLRDDGFFDARSGADSSASELVEGIFLKAKNEHEKLKLPYVAKFMANACFASAHSPANLTYLLSLAESLTYRQMCELKFAALYKAYIVGESFDISLNDGAASYMEVTMIANEIFSLLGMKVLDIFDLEILNTPLTEREFDKNGIMKQVYPESPEAINPSSLKLSMTGTALVNMLELYDLPQEDVNLIFWHTRAPCFKGHFTKKEFLALSFDQIKEWAYPPQESAPEKETDSITPETPQV